MYCFPRVLFAILILFAVLGGTDVTPFHDSQAAKEGVYGNYTRQSYLSDPSFVGPVANILVLPSQGVSPSKYVGWAPCGPLPAQGLPLLASQPMLIDANTMSAVWFGPLLEKQAMGPTVQSCNGSDYLTWWTGREIFPFAQGSFLMANNKYEVVYNITARSPLRPRTDPHEITITSHCTAIITVSERHRHDLTAHNRSDGWLTDSYFQEIDLATGKLLFHWQASEQFPDVVAEARYKLGWREGRSEETAWDWFHINSVIKDHTGNYLVSSRHTSTIYYISGTNGTIIWRLGGSSSDFKDMSGGKATDMSWQHHARWINRNRTKLSLYDNRSMSWGKSLEKSPMSRGIILELDYTKREVTLIRSYGSTRGFPSAREGSMQVLADSPGNVMLGYGGEPGWTEFSANGTVLLDVGFGPPGRGDMTVDNYRALKVNWTGDPSWGPSIAPGPKQDYIFNETIGVFSVRLHDRSGHRLANDTVYFSWNGATEVKSWVVLMSNTTDLCVSQDLFTRVVKTGFEDCVHVGTDTRYVVALAVDGLDRVLGATDILDMFNSSRSDGPGGPRGNDTAALTDAWRRYVASQPDDTPISSLRSGRHRATPSAGTWMASSLLLLAVLCSCAAAMLYGTGLWRYAVVRADGYELVDNHMALGHSYSATPSEEDDMQRQRNDKWASGDG